MKAVKGKEKSYYLDQAPIAKEFDTIEQAAKYLADKYNSSVEYMTHCIMDETNRDAVYFFDGTVVLLESI